MTATDTTPRERPTKESRSHQVRYTRRRGLIGLGVAMLAAGGGGAYALAQAASDAAEVIAITSNVPRGHTIEETDLTIASAAHDPAVKTIPADQLDDIIGQRAAADLTSGSLLAPDAVTNAMLPAGGQTIVGVAVTEAQMPTDSLAPGDLIRVFNTPNPGDSPPKSAPESTQATVVSISGLTDTGHIVINVLVDHDLAGELVARVATGRVGIALDSLEDGATE